MSALAPTPATLEDLPEILTLVGAAGLPTEGISDAIPQGYAVVRDGAALLGVAGLEHYGESALLRSVAISPDVRGKGLGRALVSDRLSAARRKHIQRVYLLTTTAPDYFRALGFDAADRAQAPALLQQSREFASLCPASAVCLAISL